MNHVMSQQVITPSTSPTLAINERVREMWDKGETVFHLGFGESRMPLHPRLVSALSDCVRQKSYLEAAGLSELREEIAGFYVRNWGLGFDANQVVLGPGSKALLFGIMLGLDCDIYLPTPSWVSYAPQAELAGKQVSYLPGTFNNGYEITPESIESAIKENGSGRIPLLVLNSPNNPSGKVLSVEKLQELAAFCREHGVIVVSDEIYALTTFDKQQHHSIAEFYPEGTIIVGGPSKHLSLGGWRLGAALLPKSPIGSMLTGVLKTIASEIWSSPTSAIQFAAIAAYSNDPEIGGYIQACTDLHEIKTRLLARSFRQLGIRCTHPEGGFYFIANFDGFCDQLETIGIETSDQLANHLLNKFQIATLPGSVFGIDPLELSLRISCSYIDMETDEQAQCLMSKFLANKRSLQKSDLPNSFLAIKQLGNFIADITKPKAYNPNKSRNEILRPWVSDLIDSRKSS